MTDQITIIFVCLSLQASEDLNHLANHDQVILLKDPAMKHSLPDEQVADEVTGLTRYSRSLMMMMMTAADFFAKVRHSLDIVFFLNGKRLKIGKRKEKSDYRSFVFCFASIIHEKKQCLQGQN